MQVDAWFIVVFVLFWIAGPLTQVLQLIAPELHHKLGLMEADAFNPEFRWYLLEERAVAIADMTCLVSGAAFVLLALVGNDTALIFGLYSCACYIYFGAVYIPRTILLRKNDLSPVSGKQFGIYMFYVGLFFLFGLYGLAYLWRLAQA